MKKTRVPASIDKEIHQRIKYLIKIHPELNYKKISRFVNESLEEKLDKIDNELSLKKIKEVGIQKLIDEAKDLRKEIPKIKEYAEKTDAEVIKLRDIIDSLVIELTAKEEENTHTV